MVWWQLVLIAATPCICGFIGGHLYARGGVDEVYEEGYSSGWDDSVITLFELSSTRKQSYVIASINKTAGIIFERRKKAQRLLDEE